MADRTVDVNLAKSSSASNKITEADKARQDKKARLAEVLDRGVVGDRLRVQVKEGLHYEWPHKDDMTRMSALGFRAAEKEDMITENASMHDTADGKIRIGDCVLMVCDRETKELIDEVKEEKKSIAHAPKGGKQKEEREFEGAVDPTSAGKAGSRVNTARATDITGALDAVNRQKTQS